MDNNSSVPCACRNLHWTCDVATCDKAKYADWEGNGQSLKQYRRCVTERGCQSCCTVMNALLIPEIKSIWQDCIALALHSGRDVDPGIGEDDENIGVDIETPQRLTGGWFLRTRASQSSQDWRHFDLWQDPTVKFTKKSSLPAPEDANCKAFSPRICHPVQRTDSRQSLEHLKCWLTRCDETHPRCLMIDTKLPTRLLKIADDQVRVVDTEEGAQGRYMTLSHRWGANEAFKLTKSNILSLKQNISWTLIPKLYQDVIGITRKLEIDYIWIDSLCIIQDDLSDWEKEAILMRTVYGNSYLNIAVCHARDSDGDLFSSSDLKNRFPTYPVPGTAGIYIRQQPHMTHTDYGSNYSHSTNHQVLLSRGWVLQERILPPRVVYYDADELKWECNVATDCQCGGMSVISNFKVDYMLALGGSLGPAAFPVMWMRIVQRYSRLHLTYGTDRVIALAGIADQALKAGFGGRYLAGLWESNLAYQICWEISDTHQKAAKYLAPSWSWLSVFGSVNFVHYSNPRRWTADDKASFAIEITEAQCTFVNNRTGAMTGGFLKVNGKWVHLLAKMRNLGSDRNPPTYYLVHEESTLELGVLFRPDYVMSAEQATAVHNVCALFWGIFDKDQVAFLVLKKLPGDEEKFERLGIWWHSEKKQDGNLKLLLQLCQIGKDITIV
ncbi:HET domain-containing protein [Xylaria telfairii]|nr:HET domain-containing protein [Xylaria telfairii]